MNNINDATIVQQLIENKDHFKELLKPLIVQRQQWLDGGINHRNQLDSEFKERCIYALAGYFTGTMGVPVDQVIELLEEVNILEYLE